MQYLQSRKFSDFFENFLLTSTFNSWYNTGVERESRSNKKQGKEHETMTTTTTNMELARKLNRINKLANDMDIMKHELDALKAEVMGYMTSNDLVRLESGGKIATLVESVRTTVDTKVLKERYADIAAECSKTSVVKYIRVK